MEPQRYLRCLGQPVLFAPSGEPVRFRTRKHLALLVYLAVENRSHRRDRLAELLWPHASSTEARHSLATALSILRPRLGLDALETSRDHARLLLGRVALDLDRLQSGDVLGSKMIEPLEVAGFLEGFDITDSTEFTHWKDRQQARLLPMIKDALLVLIDRCRRTGDTRQIEQLADRMLALDDLCEDAIRAKMEARAFAGDRLTALEIFEAWKKRLADELQAAPSDLVEGMAVRLRRRGWERTTLENVPNVPTDHWRNRPFIGRSAEYRMLYDLWEAARKGLPSHALVLGDSGVGKSTLVQRLTTAAGLEGAAISRVQCYDVEREIPYSTLTGLITGLLNSPGVSATSPDALAELSRILPAIVHQYPSLPLPSESQGETARIRITEAFLEMLTAVAEDHPVILVIDDLHLADDVSIAVVHLIMRRARGKPIMFILLARPGELGQSSHATRLRESAPALGVGEIEVLPLSDPESREMLNTLFKCDEPQPGLTEQRALLTGAAGYPMVLELLVQDWKESGAEALALTVDAMTAEPGVCRGVQASYNAMLNRITRSLDVTTHNVLNLASILGHRLNDLSMYALVDLSVGQTMTAMAELVARRVLRDGSRGLEFVNELVRAAVYVGFSPSLRRVLHGRIAERYIQEQSLGNDDLGLEIAWHSARAGRTRQATQYLLCGARSSMQKGAVHAAERALSTALDHLDDVQRGETTLLLAEVLQEQGRWLESLELLHKAGTDCDPALALVLSVLAEQMSTFLSPQQIRTRLEQLRGVVTDTCPVSIRVKAARVGAILMANLRDAEMAKELLAVIDSIPLAALNLDDLASLATSKAKLLYIALERSPGLHKIVEIADTLRAKGYVNSTVGSLHTGLGNVACCEGRYLDAKASFIFAYDIYTSLGNDTSRSAQAAQIALCCFRLGQYGEATQWCITAMANFGAHFAGYAECQAALSMGWSYALLGEFDKALEPIRRVDSRLSLMTTPRWMKQAWGLHKADILLVLGQYSDALVIARDAIGNDSRVLYSAFFAGPFSRWLALTSRGTEAEGGARAQLTRMIDQLELYDAIDQVEILCAGRKLRLEPILEGRSNTLLESKLAKLPQSVSTQLVRLHMY